MLKRISAIAVAGGATVALMAGTTPAFAATWTVSPGGSVTASGSGQVKDARTGTVAKCTSIKVTKASLKSGSGLSGTGIGTISSSSFSGCTIATIAVTVTTQDLPWKLNAASYNATTGVTKGTLTKVRLLATAPGCSATLQGSTATNGKITVSYTNSTGVLKFLGGGNLTSENVSGCFGLIANGDAQQASGSLTVSPKQKITSP